MNTRLVGLTAVAALLAGYVAYATLGNLGSGGRSPAPTAVAVPARTAAVKLNPLEGILPDAYPAIVERPLFNPTRQPRPAAPPPPPPALEQPVQEAPPPPAPEAPGPEDYKLLGVSSGPDGRIAALRIAATGDVVYLRKGESIDSWSVIDVGDRSVAIGTSDNPVTFNLFATADDAGEADGQPMPDDAMPPQPPLPLPLPKQPPPLPDPSTVPNTGG